MVRWWPNGTAEIPTVTAEFGGDHPLTGYHRGIDLIGYVWNCAADDGRVILAGPNSTAGNEVKILHTDGYITRYLHNADASLLVRVGQRVARGDRLGRMGGTGYVNGVHCHFEVIAPDGTTRINPREYIAPAVPAATTSTPLTTPTIQEDDMIRIQATERGIALIGPGYYRMLKTDEEVVQSGKLVTKHLTGNARQFDLWKSMALNGLSPAQTVTLTDAQLEEITAAAKAGGTEALKALSFVVTAA